ncbi:MAG: ATP-binding protein [Myxococcales bacterium]|nr:ATP-binding protein [Myxococcales bacterium]MBK7198211.1 ATP-binding protein [Myxococcales bacterium]MBP6845327.1 ATP-binding protein [Kofleriaceae bacterium]
MANPATAARYMAAIERVRLRAIRAIELGSTPRRDDHLAVLDAQLAAVEATLIETAVGARDGALARRLELGPDELDFLWTAVAMTADPRLWPHLQRLGGGDTARGASVGLHALLAQLEGERALGLGLAIGPASPLVRHHLLVAADALPLAARRFVAAPRVAAYLAGDPTPDAEVLAVGGVIAPPADRFVDAAGDALIAQLTALLAGAPPPVLVLDGSPGVGRRTAVAIAAAATGRPTIGVDLARLPLGVDALDAALAALGREVVLTGAVAVIAGADQLDREGDRTLARILAKHLDALPGPAALVTLERGLEVAIARPLVRVSVPTPPVATRRALWDRALGDAPVTPDERDRLAMRYKLGPGGVGAAITTARRLGASDAPRLPDVVAGIRNNIAERMGGLAQRVEVKQAWDELVLGADTLDQVRALAARVQHGHTVLEKWRLGQKLHRGSGVAALFSGPPGTGKTMVAGLIARQLELELYQVDLSKVVSKWVGETEKQLAQIFDAADAGHALLLFDEADALFAKRTEVKAAVDRYANLEVNYLLQRVEAFGGITILTTNLDQSIDPALMRRLAGHVRFWPPELDERVALWKSMLNPDLPVADDLDVDELATRYPEMTGANIRNAAIAGAFLAAAEGVPVAQQHLLRAARIEYVSMGRQLGGQSR